MNAPITCCPCEERLPIANEEIVPIAGIPEPAPLPMATLPEWIIVPILAYLTGVSALIIMVGWWLAAPPAPTSMAKVMAAPIQAEQPIVLTETPIATESLPVVASEEPPAYEDPAPESFVVPRRMPSALEPMPLPSPSTLPTAVRLDQPSEKALASPKEIAKYQPDALHFSLRRLSLPGDGPKPLKLAVTLAGHDDIGNILTKMGAGYRFTSLRSQDLFSEAALRNQDVIFLTCANIYAHDFQSVIPLRKFVEAGGTLYASDLRSDIVLAAFPEFRARPPIFPGVPQSVEAQVVDRNLETYLGRKTIPLNFEAPGWRPAAFDPAKVTVCLQGAYRDNLGQTVRAPLLVKFRVKKGTVIFTSFHHSKNDSELVRKLLDYLVFASVNARSEARVRELMQRYDFAPDDLRPLVLHPGQPQEHAFPHPGGGLQIALGFENQGAKLKLMLRAPTGQTIEHEDQGIYLLDVPNAPAGVWRYTVTPIELPHPNFPVLVAVGRLKS